MMVRDGRQGALLTMRGLADAVSRGVSKHPEEPRRLVSALNQHLARRADGLADFFVGHVFAQEHVVMGLA
jgi:hypothetical protein